MLKFFRKPYPFNDDLKRNAKIIFFLSISIFLFLLVFQPLDITNLENREKIYLVIGLGVITFLSFSINLMVMPSLFPKIFIHRQWKIWKEIIWNSWLLFVTAFGYLLMYKTLGILAINFTMILKMVLIAVIPLTILIVFNQNRLLRLHLKTANDMNKKLKDSKNSNDKLITFDSEYQKDKLSVKAKLLLLVRSADNYIEVFWKDGTSIKNKLIRTTLVKTQQLLSEYSYFFKCHRSYIVNINYIDRVEGNSQGYKLFFDQLNFEVPVSKTSVNRLKEKINRL
jgi:DNA-binding LytR/AlgR family response regulator